MIEDECVGNLENDVHGCDTLDVVPRLGRNASNSVRKESEVRHGNSLDDMKERAWSIGAKGWRVQRQKRRHHTLFQAAETISPRAAGCTAAMLRDSRALRSIMIQANHRNSPRRKARGIANSVDPQMWADRGPPKLVRDHHVSLVCSSNVLLSCITPQYQHLCPKHYFCTERCEI